MSGTVMHETAVQNIPPHPVFGPSCHLIVPPQESCQISDIILLAPPCPPLIPAMAMDRRRGLEFDVILDFILLEAFFSVLIKVRGREPRVEVIHVLDCALPGPFLLVLELGNR